MVRAPLGQLGVLRKVIQCSVVQCTSKSGVKVDYSTVQLSNLQGSAKSCRDLFFFILITFTNIPLPGKLWQYDTVS